MQSIAATVNQEASAPDSNSSEYSLWLEYMNRAVQEWANANDWEVLKKTFWPGVTGASTATVTLPQDYRKLARAPILYSSSNSLDGEGEEIPDIPEETRGLYISTDKYVYETGNLSGGYSLVFHPGTLASGASLAITYFSIPTSLASPAEVPAISDSQFLIDRVVGYIFEARSDPRFQQEETKAREKLLQMVEMQNDQKYNSYSNPQYVMNGPLAKMRFRVGRD